jgi:hypothetical protein
MSRRLLVLVALLGWLATGCQVDLVAGVDVNRDGSGQVTASVGLDAEAAQQLGDVGHAFRVDDLRQAGWKVVGPRKEGDGLTWVRASKPFAAPDQAQATMAELAGPAGPFRDFHLIRTKSLLRSTTTFTGVVDLTGGLTGLSDADLTQRLGDVDLGLDLDGLRRRFGDDLAKSVKVQVTAGLPGKVVTNAPARDGGRALWSPDLGQSVRMQASSNAFKVAPGLVAAALAAVLVPVLAVIVAVRRRRRGRQRRGGGR